ncbi:AMP-binding enzyme [Streptomyces ziwulingensis]|uniref:AMP-binding enzyme C-terminal domain-containing protein n=1 Tax=Streptomyces ziwulingensis TaxID=1045501 RepID=A0ABP9BXK8_9ACTN
MTDTDIYSDTDTDIDTDAADAGFARDFFALEGELLELACVRECAVVPTELPELGASVVVAFVPLGPEQEVAGRRAVLAACRRNLPDRYARAVAVDEVPRTVDGAVRAAELLDQVLPQIARDLMSPASMTD